MAQLVRLTPDYVIREEIKTDEEGKRTLWVFVNRAEGQTEFRPLAYLTGFNCLKYELDKKD